MGGVEFEKTGLRIGSGLRFQGWSSGVTGFGHAGDVSVWCLGGNGGMDPYSSPYTIPNNSPIIHSPILY